MESERLYLISYGSQHFGIMLSQNWPGKLLQHHSITEFIIMQNASSKCPLLFSFNLV